MHQHKYNIGLKEKLVTELIYFIVLTLRNLFFATSYRARNPISSQIIKVETDDFLRPSGLTVCSTCRLPSLTPTSMKPVKMYALFNASSPEMRKQ